MAAHNELALAIIEAAKRREESFDHCAAAAARNRVVDAESFYKLSLRDACEADGVNPFLSYPVFLMLSTNWNEALEWAQLNKV